MRPHRHITHFHRALQRCRGTLGCEVALYIAAQLFPESIFAVMTAWALAFLALVMPYVQA